MSEKLPDSEGLEEFRSLRSALDVAISNLTDGCVDFFTGLNSTGVESDYFQSYFDEVTEKYDELKTAFIDFKNYMECGDEIDNNPICCPVCGGVKLRCAVVGEVGDEGHFYCLSDGCDSDWYENGIGFEIDPIADSIL